MRNHGEPRLRIGRRSGDGFRYQGGDLLGRAPGLRTQRGNREHRVHIAGSLARSASKRLFACPDFQRKVESRKVDACGKLVGSMDNARSKLARAPQNRFCRREPPRERVRECTVGCFFSSAAIALNAASNFLLLCERRDESEIRANAGIGRGDGLQFADSAFFVAHREMGQGYRGALCRRCWIERRRPFEIARSLGAFAVSGIQLPRQRQHVGTSVVVLQQGRMAATALVN
jgi:hypothetical protein